MDPVPFFIMGLMVGSVSILLVQAYGRRRTTRDLGQGQREG